jgi:hypothetical protein
MTWNSAIRIGNFVLAGRVQTRSFQPAFTPGRNWPLRTPSASYQYMFVYSVGPSDQTCQRTRSGWPGTSIRVLAGHFVTPMLRAFL